LHKAVGKQITINKEPHKSYPGSGAEGLVNGISGSDSRYGDKEWLGFWGEDIEITIDLGEETEINSIETRFHNGQGQWIYAPREIEIGFDDHGLDSKTEIPLSSNIMVPLKIKLNETSQKIYLKFKNYGIIPEGKQGAGNKAWTFIDEIIVN
jgi:hexosaminidase